MKELSIEVDDLITALQNGSYEMEYFLDLQTGEIHFTIDKGIADPDEEFEALLEKDPDRFQYIQPLSSRDSWLIMAEFIDQLPDGDAANALANAVRRTHPFRRFKDTLLNYPDLRDQWFAFEHRAMLDIARKWLEEAEISWKNKD